MSKQIYRLWIPDEYRKAGPSDLIELKPVPGFHPLFFRKAELEQIAYAIVANEPCHISGPTGTAKILLDRGALPGAGEFFRALRSRRIPEKAAPALPHPGSNL